MSQKKWKITAQIVSHRTRTVRADTPEEAVEKASRLFEQAGHETVGAMRFEAVPDPKEAA